MTLSESRNLSSLACFQLDSIASTMFTVLFIVSVFYQGHAVVNYGTDFITAFPENIAYYYPISVSNSLKITALHDNTHVSVAGSGTNIQQMTMNSGVIRLVNLPDAFEVYKLGLSMKSVRITSDNNITVFAISQRGASVQTNIVQPLSNLGKMYVVPFPNYTDTLSLTNNYDALNWIASTNVIPTYNQFRLLIINAEAQNNSVVLNLLQSSGSSQFTLGPFELMQIQSPESVLRVSSSAYLAVLLTHPCMDTEYCKCSMLLQQLQPAYLQQNSFLVPPYYTPDQTHLILTSDQAVELRYGSPPLSGGIEILQPNSSQFLPFFPSIENGSASITTSQPVSISLIHPGVMMGLIPISMFSACYLLHITSSTSSEALLIAETNQTQYVHLDQNLVSVTWSIMSGTTYSWAHMNLQVSMSHIVWHPSSKIGVYIIEKMSSLVTYSSPGISVNEEPDPNGCMVIPAKLDIGNQPMSWQRSCEYCLNKGGILVSPSLSVYQSMMSQMLTDAQAHGQAWIGLRRSLITMDWYWQSKDNFDFTNWDNGQPEPPEKGLCAFTTMAPGSSYAWRSDFCCSLKKPICYIPAVYVSLNLYA